MPRPVAQRQRIARIEEAGDDHERVAGVQLEGGERGKVTLGGDHENADQRDCGAEYTHRTDAHAVEQRRADDHEDRDRTLQDGDVHGRRVVRRDIEERVEHREAARSHEEDADAVAAKLRPGGDELPASER